MASKGKKGGKKKGQTLNLTDFLSGGNAGGTYSAPGSGATAVVTVGGSSWADEMDDADMYDSRPKQQVVIPTAPRAALGPGVDDERIPRSPPYTAYIANLPYDVDEEQVQDVFVKARLKVNSVRLMKEEGGRLKGFGYVDFVDRESLCDALVLSDLAVNNRKIRIDLASGAGKDGQRSGGFGDRDGRPGREEDPNAGRSDSDTAWRSGPAPPSRDQDRDRGRGGGGGGFDRYEAPRDRGFGGGFSRGDRDERSGGRSYGFGGDRDGGDRYGGGRDRDDRYGGGRRSPEAPKERPRLNLAPRTTPKEEEARPAPAQTETRAAAEPKKSVNPFGSAKPVDSTQREKEITEKLGKMEVKDDRPSSYRPPGARDREERGGGGGYERRDDRGGYDRSDDRSSGYGRDRRDDRGGYDRGGSDRRDDRGGSDRRDDRGGYDRRDDRGGYGRDDRGGSSRGGGNDRDDRGGYDRGSDRREVRRDNDRNDRGDYDRRDYNRRDNDRRDNDRRDYDRRDYDRRDYDRRDNDRREGDRYNGGSRDDRGEAGREEGEKPVPAMKKYEEPKAPELVAKNVFALLPDESGSASDNEN